MGLFAAYLYSAGAWAEMDPSADEVELPDAPWLHLYIHDSDFAVIRYEPSGSASGTAFLGITPRDYFDNPEASAPTDTAMEAEGLVRWAGHAATRATPSAQSLQELLAADGAEQPDWDDPNLSEDEIFVEGKCRRFATQLGLPLPPDL